MPRCSKTTRMSSAGREPRLRPGAFPRWSRTPPLRPVPARPRSCSSPARASLTSSMYVSSAMNASPAGLVQDRPQLPGPPPQVRGDLRVAAGGLQQQQSDQRGRGQLPLAAVLPGAGQVVEQELEPGQPLLRRLPAVGSGRSRPAAAQGWPTRRGPGRRPAGSPPAAAGPRVLRCTGPRSGSRTATPERHQRVVAALVLDQDVDEGVSSVERRGEQHVGVPPL